MWWWSRQVLEVVLATVDVKKRPSGCRILRGIRDEGPADGPLRVGSLSDTIAVWRVEVTGEVSRGTTEGFAMVFGDGRMESAFVLPVTKVGGSVKIGYGRVSVPRYRSTTVRMTASVSPISAPNTLIPKTDGKKLRIGVIGAGRIGQVHAENINLRIKNAVLAGVSSGTRSLADFCGYENSCNVYYSHDDLLEDSDIDAVCICSASNQHTEQIIHAASKGKHIFCEKPIDTDLTKIDDALRAVEKAGVKLQVGFNRRFDRNYERVKQAVVSKEIGEMHMIRIFSRDPDPPSIEYLKKSGGIWLDCTIHDFDMARFLVGSEVEEVYALGAVNLDKTLEEIGDVDTSVVMLKFKNGVIGTIDNSRKAVYGYDQRCEVFGSEGSVAIENNFSNSATLSTAESISHDLPYHFFMDRYTDSFVNEMRDFVNCVLDDDPVSVTGIDGRMPVVIALAAKRSYYEARPVRLSEIDPKLA